MLYVDADMLLRAPLDPIELGAKRGRVVSEHVGYLDVGIRNGLVDNFVRRGGAWARAAGWYHIFHIDDLRTLAPDWLRYCRQMRTNPQLYWNINGSIPKNIPTGDAYVKYGEAPWISEMYGYVFSAAEHQIDTKLLRGLVEYTDSGSSEPWPAGPAIIHYGLHCHVGSYHFTKYDYGDFDVNSCPRVFFRPPNAPKRHEKLCAETINTLNDALCDFTARVPSPPRPRRRAARRTSSPARPAPTSTRMRGESEERRLQHAGDSVKLFADVLQVLRRRPPALPGVGAQRRVHEEPWVHGVGVQARVQPVPRRRRRRRCPRRIAASPPPPAAAATTASLGHRPPRRTRCRRTRRTSGRRAAQERAAKATDQRRRQRASPSTDARGLAGREWGGRAPRRARGAEAEAERVAAAAAKSRAFASRQGASAARALLPKLILVWAALSFGLALFVYRHFRRRRSKAVAQAGLPRAV